MPDLFPLHVVIPNWNLKQDTIACISSLVAASQALDVSIVVVDNGSTDGSMQALAAAFGERVIQLPAGYNRGFAAAVNMGIKYALDHQAASILLLNNDTLVAEDMLDRLCAAAEQHPEAGILAPAIYYADAPARLWRLGDRQLSWLPMPLRVPDRERERESLQVDYVTGCAMLVRRPVIEAIGLFDERFFMYYEDADFCRRARNHGYMLRCVPAARMLHKVSTTAHMNRASNIFWHARGHVLFYRKHTHGAMRLLVHPYLALKTLSSIGLYLLHGEFLHIRALLEGTLDGYRLAVSEDNSCQAQ